MANQKNIKINHPHFKNLDALRFLAAFSVFFFHFFNEIKGLIDISENNLLYRGIIFFSSKGLLGVNFFFVLSGFLITYLVLFEIKHQKSFNLNHFLIRRTLRIWPLYFILVLIGFVLFPILFSDYITLHQPINYVLFLANFDEIWYGSHDSINFLTSPWSVAVEEQFYLVWGILLFVLSRLKIMNLPTLITLLLLFSFGFRWLNYENLRVVYYHTFAVMPDILVGAFLGYSVFKKSIWIDNLKAISKFKILVIYAVGFLLILFKTKIFTGQLIVIERYVFAVFFAFILLDQIQFKHSIFKVGKMKLFNHLGKISYGLYMYHLVVLYVLKRLLLSDLNVYITNNYVLVIIYFVLGISFTYFVALLSYKLIEKPFLRLKKRFK